MHTGYLYICRIYLADNGATTIAPGYPRPQPVSANCVRQTNACTFNIYPNINNTVTIQADGCRQIVTVNPGCAGAITVTGNTNQTVAAGTVGGNFTAVNVNWAAPYNVGIPAAGNCRNLTIQTPINCPNVSSNTCPGVTLTFGAGPYATNNVVTATSAEYVYECGNGNNGSGVWFNFVAPNSGNVNINLTSVGSGNDLDAMLYLFDSRVSALADCAADWYMQSDVCASCANLTSSCNKSDQLIYCSDLTGTNQLESIQARGLNPGETYYVMVDGYWGGSYSTGNFSIQISDAGGGPVRPVNDNCSGAIDISMNCSPFPANNIGATSLCSNDLLLSGASTENSVWYTYTPTYTGAHTILYQYANGYHCATIGAQPGVQFGIYTSSDNTCGGTFTALPDGQVSTGAVNGSVTLTLTAGQKYYILIDGYGGNECSFEFQLYNNDLCCQADLGATIGNDVVLCFGDEATFGVSADPINFGSEALSNPVIGWQFSETQPTVINPFDPANTGKDYLVGALDIVTPASTAPDVIRDWEGNYTQITGFGVLESPVNRTVSISGFPAGANTFNSATDTITVCVYVYMDNVDNMNMSLIAPDGTAYPLMNNQCGSVNGYYNVCFSNRAATNITSACPASNYAEVTGTFLPSGNWSGLNNEGINGTWTLRMSDNYADFNGIDFYGFNLEIKKAYSAPVPPVVGPRHGDVTIINNDPFQYGPQTFWLTPVTFIDYNPSLGLLYLDSCYHYGTPVKVTLLERVTTPVYTPVCNAPGDGSNGVSMTVTSPTGGLPGLPLAPVTSTLNFSNSTALNPVPDGNTTWSNRDILVSGFNAGATLTSASNIQVCVTFSPAHPYAADIDLQLVAPNGGILSLSQDRGGTGNLNGQYCFRSTGSLLPDPGNVNIATGNYLWDGSYASIANTLLNGTWRLQIRDDAGGDVGGISGWTLSLTGLVPGGVSAEAYTVTGTGAAAGITFPAPPVGENEVSNPFTLLDGQAWGVQFVDNNGCRSSISGNFDKPNIGQLLIDTTACDGDNVAYSVTMPPPLYSRYRITIDFDSYPQDISWILYDGMNNVIESGGGYAPTLGLVTYTTGLIDPNRGPYRIEIIDGYGDGLGSGGGSSNGGGSTTSNFITVEEMISGGSPTVLFNQSYAYCAPVYCVGPAASVFDDVSVSLGTPTGTFSSGVTTNLYAGTTCGGTAIANGIIPNTNSTGVVNTNAAGVNGGSSYSVGYTFTDRYNCTTSLCRPINLFPRVTINPAINCLANPPTVLANPSCPSCNATYVAEFSYNNGLTWTTATSANFQEIYTFARVRNVLTGEVACEVSSIKLGDCPTVLPIELIFIKAIPVDNRYIEVSWATAVEINTSKFEVLRSLDGIQFTKIGEVRAAGHSTTIQQYKYDDHDVTAGVVYYYQIREVDNDHNTHLTNIVHAKLDKDKFELISIYPNPMSENTVLTMYAKEVTDISLVVYNDIGQVMTNELKTLKAGLNEWKVNTEKWAKGVYYFIVTSSEKPVTKQVIKLD
jgi:subtilisin-like proprotein convertase family protein